MSRFRKVVSGIMLALGMAIPVAAFATVSVASFNIQNLGWQNSKDYKTVALITSSFDVVAVQEVMNEEGAERLHRALEKVSGEAWSYMMSHLIGRGSYKEAYAIYSRDSAARYLDGAVVYLAKVRVNPRPIEGGDTSGQRTSAAGVVVSYVSGTIHSYSQRVDSPCSQPPKYASTPPPNRLIS